MENTNMTTEQKIAQEMDALKRENRRIKIGRAASYILAAGSVIAAVIACKKLSEIKGVFNSAVTDVSNLTFIDVQQAVVDKAVEKAAKNAADRAVKETYAMMASTVSTAVTKAVDEAKTPLKQSVTDRIAKEIARIDKKELTEEIEEKAKNMILEKFEGRLDGIASDFSRNLENVGKIYQNIADTMQKKTTPTALV